MKFCSQCGSLVDLRIPEGDNLPRQVCTDCGTIHYQNPKLISGCIPKLRDYVLLCRRAIEPRYGLWTIPAGFMENGETLEEAAIRETHEEACARIEIDELYSVFSLPHVSQVYVIFRGHLLSDDFSPGPESLETVLFAEHEIPWGKIAFPVVAQTLKSYFKDRPTKKYRPFTDKIPSRCKLK